MELFDTHCHIDVADFDADRGAVLERCRGLGVRQMVVPGYVAAQWPKLLAVCAAHPGLYPAPGLHPIYTAEHAPGQLRELERLLAEVPVVAIGEIGLDYYIENPDRQAQQRYLEAQIAIAKTAGLPLLLHIRKAHDQVTATLRRLKFPHGGIAHAFNGSLQQGMRLIGLGFKLGCCATITNPNSGRIRRLFRELPLDALVLETDAPDIPGFRHRGQRNSPEYLPEVLAALAELRGGPAESIAGLTTANARALFPRAAAPG
jgi:TatD DNase family protein